MTCRDCHLPMAVMRTAASLGITTRVHQCGCGSRWETVEKISRRLSSITATGSTPLAHRQHTGSKLLLPVAHRQQPPSGGGVGGGVSSGLDSGSDPIPPSVPSQQSGARARVSGDYSPTFEAFWVSTWKAGAKGDAQKAWLANGKPTAAEAAPAIAAYLAAKRTSGQSLANVGVWLRAGGARQTEWHLVPIGKPNAQPPQRPAPYHAPVREPGWMSAPPPKPWPKCEERSDDTLTPPGWMGMDEKLAAAKGTG